MGQGIQTVIFCMGNRRFFHFLLGGAGDNEDLHLLVKTGGEKYPLIVL